eukprot:scaffold11057_cov175-Ochromonas_danica.AAC.2
MMTAKREVWDAKLMDERHISAPSDLETVSLTSTDTSQTSYSSLLSATSEASIRKIKSFASPEEQQRYFDEVNDYAKEFHANTHLTKIDDAFEALEYAVIRAGGKVDPKDALEAFCAGVSPAPQDNKETYSTCMRDFVQRCNRRMEIIDGNSIEYKRLLQMLKQIVGQVRQVAQEPVPTGRLSRAEQKRLKKGKNALKTQERSLTLL